jgi:hypothetical protein
VALTPATLVVLVAEPLEIQEQVALEIPRLSLHHKVTMGETHKTLVRDLPEQVEVALEQLVQTDTPLLVRPPATAALERRQQLAEQALHTQVVAVVAEH